MIELFVFSFIFIFFDRCIQLIEPALTDTDAKHIERLISIYMDENSTKSPSSEENGCILSADDKIYTLDEFLHGNVPTESSSDVTVDSIWRVAPGMSVCIHFSFFGYLLFQS